jgi:putative CocE/NonD family hydrolase
LGSVSSEYDFGVFASTLGADFVGLQLDHFAHHLKGEQNGVDDAPPVRIFVMGENAWRDENEWPLARTEYVRWFLHSDGAAKSEGGSLSPDEPGEEAADAYLYDPRDPAPTVGGAVGLPGLVQGVNVGPRDQRPVEARSDVLVYTSTVLEEPLEVTGPLTATLHAASSAQDTDFIVRLCDVYPDDASRILAEGVVRARYRDGYNRPSLIQPGEVYAYEIDLVATSNVFRPGHRIRVDVTSSSFPYLDRNSNTGNPLGEDGPEDLQPAVQTVFHDVARPSHLVLPVIPR